MRPKMKKFNKDFTTFDVERILEIKRTRLQEWINRGFVVPFKKADGKGDKTIFTHWDLYMVKLFEYLVNRGFSRVEASLRIKTLITQKESRDQYSHRYVAIGGPEESDFHQTIKDAGHKDVLHVLAAMNVMSFHRIEELDLHRFLSCKDILIVDFQKIRDEVDAAIG